MTTELVQFPQQGYRMKQMADRGWAITAYTPELLPEQVRDLVANSSNAGWGMFKPNEFVQADVPSEPAPVEDGQKTPSQRLRAVIWRIWEANGSKGDFDTHYRQVMNNLTEQLKEKYLN